MSQSYTNLLYHLIFSIKERRPIISLNYKSRLYDYIGRIIAASVASHSGSAAPRIMFTYARNCAPNARCQMSCVY